MHSVWASWGGDAAVGAVKQAQFFIKQAVFVVAQIFAPLGFFAVCFGEDDETAPPFVRQEVLFVQLPHQFVKFLFGLECQKIRRERNPLINENLKRRLITKKPKRNAKSA